MCSPTLETHIPSDMCSLTWEICISLVMCLPLPGEHISLVICVSLLVKPIYLVICVSLPQKHILLVLCVPLPGKHISLVVCFFPAEEHISLVILVFLVICVPLPAQHTSIVICFSLPRKHISIVTWVVLPIEIEKSRWQYGTFHLQINDWVNLSSILTADLSFGYVDIKTSKKRLWTPFSVSHSWSNHFICDLYLTLLPLTFHRVCLHASIKVSLSNSDTVSMLSCLTAASNLDWTVYINSDMSSPTGPAGKHMLATFWYSPATKNLFDNPVIIILIWQLGACRPYVHSFKILSTFDWLKSHC